MTRSIVPAQLSPPNPSGVGVVFRVSPAPRGNDTTGDGSFSAPWATIQHALDTVAEGDVIEVEDGDYDENLLMKVVCTVRAVNRRRARVVVGAGGGNALTIDSTIAQHVTYDTIRFAGMVLIGGTGGNDSPFEFNAPGGGMSSKQHNVEFHDCELLANAIGVTKNLILNWDQGMEAHDISFFHCRISCNGTNSPCNITTRNTTPHVFFCNCNGDPRFVVGATQDAGASYDNCLFRDGYLDSGGNNALVVLRNSDMGLIGITTPFAGGELRALAVTEEFRSTEQTGTGAPQNIAHGLDTVPSLVLIFTTELAAGLAAGHDIAEGTHDATNVKVTVTNGAKFIVYARR